MNYFAHAVWFLDEDPYFIAGTAVPDWLAVVDRRVRVKLASAEPYTKQNGSTGAVARGLVQHLRDDAQFHGTVQFIQLSAQFARIARELLDDDESFRPSFLGHLLVEVLIDATLVANAPTKLNRYYALLGKVNAQQLQQDVNQLARGSTYLLAYMVRRFLQEQILWDYLADDTLLNRLNQVMRRVGFPPLPTEFRHLLPQMRRSVEDCMPALISGIPVDCGFCR